MSKASFGGTSIPHGLIAFSGVFSPPGKCMVGWTKNESQRSVVSKIPSSL